MQPGDSSLVSVREDLGLLPSIRKKKMMWFYKVKTSFCLQEELYLRDYFSGTWWCTPVVPALQRMMGDREELQALQAS